MDDDQNPYSPPEGSEGSEGESVLVAVGAYREQKLRQLIWMVVLFAVTGFVSAVLDENSVASNVVDLATALTFVVLVLRWCALDREERGLDPWPYFVVMMVICPGPLILVPTYLCATRGAQGLLSSLLAAGFLVLLIVVSMVTAFLGLWATGQLI